MKLGVDLSIQDELNEFHPIYRYDGKEIEPFSFFKNHSNIDVVRLRLWHHPFDENGRPYGGGTNDIGCLLRLARKAKEVGLKVLVDFHYSDFWTDPSRQLPPKAWKNLSLEELKIELYKYTKNVLESLKKEDIDVIAVQVGNEITNGMIFPFANVWEEKDGMGGFYNHVSLFNEGYRAVKEVYQDAKVICHLEHSGSHDMQNYYFSKMISCGAKFDVIGESYYPYWHGGFPLFIDNIIKLKEKFDKEIWVVEMGYEYETSRLANHHFEYKNMGGDEFNVGNLSGRIPFPINKEGQKNYLKAFLSLCKSLGIGMVFYWEPTWIFLPHQGWAKEAGQIYLGLSPEEASNDWANETLFDFEGNACPAIDIFTQQFVDSLE